MVAPTTPCSHYHNTFPFLKQIHKWPFILSILSLSLSTSSTQTIGKPLLTHCTKSDDTLLKVTSSMNVCLTLNTTRSCGPSFITVPSSFISRTNAIAKFFSLLSFAAEKEAMKCICIKGTHVHTVKLPSQCLR